MMASVEKRRSRPQQLDHTNHFFSASLSLFDLYKVNILKSKLYLQVGGPEQDQDEHVLYIQ